MIKLAAVIYLCILVAAFSVGLTVGDGDGFPAGEMVLVHGHASETVYEIWIPADQLEGFLDEEGALECEVVCHIEEHEHELEHVEEH